MLKNLLKMVQLLGVITQLEVINAEVKSAERSWEIIQYMEEMQKLNKEIVKEYKKGLTKGE